MDDGGNWPQVHFSLSSGQSTLGLRLNATLGRELSESDRRIIARHMGELEEELMRESTRTHPDNVAWKTRWLVEARDVFHNASLSPIYVKEIPNGYCNCCPHRVWLLVTTSIGVIKIGWRKSVIHLEWADSDVEATAEQLFPNEQVTKGDRYIHAYGYKKATEYLRALREAAHG